MVAGVYQILNRVTGSRYIGSSTDASQTIASMPRVLSSLDRPVQLGKAFSLESKLSEDWFDYGEENFSLTLIEQTSRHRFTVGQRSYFWCRLLQPIYNCQRYDPIISGIYQMFNVKNGYSYIGQSKDIFFRWNQHKSRLRSNSHYNQSLQDCFNRWGENSFELRILEVCIPSKQTLELSEKAWIKRSQNLFNVVHSIA